ncbi:MAG TPA: hypothetical protein VN722_02540 [Hanamia sp.]|jgi:hypothetical protein|nr:hypothetical protein [Hanamia sp.]
MKFLLTILLFFVIAAGCKQKLLSGPALENKLKETMTNYLHKTLKPGVQFTVKDVNYFPEPTEKAFVCQFHVHMQYENKDTTGLMIATISNDFNKVQRTQ